MGDVENGQESVDVVVAEAEGFLVTCQEYEPDEPAEEMYEALMHGCVIIVKLLHLLGRSTP